MDADRSDVAGIRWCKTCGQLDTPSNREALFDIYWRIPGGKQHIEPLVYTGEEFEDSWDDLHEENYAMLAMERNMAERMLCPDCGLPNLQGVDESQLMTHEEAKDLADMYAEMAAERRAGC